MEANEPPTGLLNLAYVRTIRHAHTTVRPSSAPLVSRPLGTSASFKSLRISLILIFPRICFGVWVGGSVSGDIPCLSIIILLPDYRFRPYKNNLPPGVVRVNYMGVTDTFLSVPRLFAPERLTSLTGHAILLRHTLRGISECFTACFTGV